jgi:transcriptional regulator with XRE-family HTH domain
MILREARRKKGFSQAALAAASGAGRITIARLEAGGAGDFRVGTLARLCEALGLELSAAPRGARPAQEALLARESAKARRLDLRRRHAALATALLAVAPADAAAMVDRARANVERWQRESLCSEHYVSRWRTRLEGPVRTIALRLLEHGEWTDALLQNSPWSFALEPAAA